MLKHTPGPWHTQKSDHQGGLLIKPIPGQVVAQCDELPNMRANAVLIAAAPELLDACKVALNCLAIEYKENGIIDARKALHTFGVLREVIEKAEGR